MLFSLFYFFLLHSCGEKNAYEEKNALFGTEEGAVYFFGTITAPGTWPFRQTSWTTTGGEKMDARWDTFSPSFGPEAAAAWFPVAVKQNGRDRIQAGQGKSESVMFTSSWSSVLTAAADQAVVLYSIYFGQSECRTVRSRREAEFVQEYKFNRKSWSSWIQM